MLKLTALASALLLGLASGQTFTKCDPLVSGNCPPDPALGGSLFVDFSQGSSDKFTAVDAPSKIAYSSDGADFTISQSGDNPTIQSNFYVMFGRFESVLRVAPGQGIVSSFVLQSDDLDEIDLEWIGGDTTQMQSNWFSKGQTTTFDRGQFHPVDSPQTIFHNYTVDWNQDRAIWYIDGNVVRVLESNDPEGYPQSPMMMRIGSWAGGDTSLNPPGTVEWAGGPTNFGAGPFVFTVKSLFVQDYSTGTEYTYGDRSGSWTSIQAANGKVGGNEDSAPVQPPAPSVAAGAASTISALTSLPPPLPSPTTSVALNSISSAPTPPPPPPTTTSTTSTSSSAPPPPPPSTSSTPPPPPPTTSAAPPPPPTTSSTPPPPPPPTSSSTVIETSSSSSTISSTVAATTSAPVQSSSEAPVTQASSVAFTTIFPSTSSVSNSTIPQSNGAAHAGLSMAMAALCIVGLVF